jgi:hypothetical protein
MVVTSQCKIALRPGSVFCFGTILSIVDEKGTLHRIADPLEKKFSLEILRKAGARQRVAQLPVPQAKITSYKPQNRSLLAQRTLLPTSPTKGVDADYKKERDKRPEKRDGTSPSFLSGTFALKGGRKETCYRSSSVLPRHPLHRGGGRLESSPISDDELIVQGEEPPQR